MAITIIMFIIASLINVLHGVIVDNNTCYGIGVDSMGRLYVAKEGVIEVYVDTIEKEKIKCNYVGPKTRFTIQEDKLLILIAIDGFHYRQMNLQGKTITNWIAITEEKYDILYEKSSICETSSGDIYEYNDDKFQYRILLNEETVIYEEPLFNAIIKRLLFIIYLITLPLIAFTMFRLSKDNHWK